MTFDSAMNAFVRPITIACDDEYYQYIGSGTAFICQYRGKACDRIKTAFSNR